MQSLPNMNAILARLAALAVMVVFSPCAMSDFDLAQESARLDALKIKERAAACNKNPKSTDPFCEARRRAQAELRKMTPPTNYPACSVWIDSVAKHEPIIINDEHVGYTPKLVALDSLHLARNYDGECRTDYFGVSISVMPRGAGCVQSKEIRTSLPRKMLFDTRLCDTRSRVDVNVFDLR